LHNEPINLHEWRSKQINLMSKHTHSNVLVSLSHISRHLILYCVTNFVTSPNVQVLSKASNFYSQPTQPPLRITPIFCNTLDMFLFARVFFYLILLTAIDGRPRPAICLLPGRLRRTLLPQDRYARVSEDTTESVSCNTRFSSFLQGKRILMQEINIYDTSNTKFLAWSHSLSRGIATQKLAINTAIEEYWRTKIQQLPLNSVVRVAKQLGRRAAVASWYMMSSQSMMTSHMYEELSISRHCWGMFS